MHNRTISRFLLSASVLVLLPGLCNAQKEAKPAPKGGYTLQGQVKNASGKVYLEELASPTTFTRKDSAIANADGAFTFTGKLKQPALYRLLFSNNTAMLVPLDNYKLEVAGDVNNLTTTASIKGSPEAELLQQMRTIRNNVPQRSPQETAQLKNFIRQHPNSLVSFYTAMAVIDLPSNIDFVDSMNTLYKKKLGNQTYVAMLQEKTSTVKNLSQGGTAPDIKLQDPDGKTIALSSLRGKYVLIDFWASWCGPCRQENPNVVRLYRQYGGSKFEIYAVSLDQDKSRWMKAIQDDNLAWKHVSDLQGWKSSAAQLYGITSIPATILLDPQGKIIAKNLRGPALEKKLAEVMGR